MVDWTERDIIELWNERIAVALDGRTIGEETSQMMRIKHDAYFGMRRLLPSGIAVPKEIQDAVKAWKQSREYRAEINNGQGKLF